MANWYFWQISIVYLVYVSMSNVSTTNIWFGRDNTGFIKSKDGGVGVDAKPSCWMVVTKKCIAFINKKMECEA